jgi:molybdopterin-binding protein
MADRILKPDTGNDLVLQNNGGTCKIELNDGQEITITIGSSSGDDFNVGSGKLLVEGDTALVSITGDIKVGGNNIEDSGGVVALTFDGSGNTNLSDKILQRPTIKDYSETGNAIGDTGASQTIDITSGNVITATLAVATTTFTFSNPSASGSCCSFTLILTQDGSGSRAVTWPGSVQWASSTAPTLSTGAADVDIFAFITVDAGTTWYGFTAGLDMDI